jgi:methyltransferase (TIGR00027 family)
MTMKEIVLESTAYWTAAVRGLESARPDRLFDDPWAAALAGSTGAVWIAERPPESVIPIVLRTRYFDDYLQRCAKEAGLRQVVVLAAGLDTRAFRLSWPAGTTIYELDRPAVVKHKEQVLAAAGAQARCERRTVSADLTEPWQARLMEAGFDSAQPSLWLLEGFLFYLPVQAIKRILDDVTALAVSGSSLGFDCINSLVLTSPFTRAWVEMQARTGAAWIGALDDPLGFLAERGWRAQVTQAGAGDANHGRWVLPVIPATMPNMPHNWYVTATRL